jgi:hypothetical protein
MRSLASRPRPVYVQISLQLSFFFAHVKKKQFVWGALVGWNSFLEHY